MPGRAAVERRVDPTDGKAYTKQDFVECYGGTAEWDAAQKVGAKAAPAQPQPKAQPKTQAPKQKEEEYRRDPADGQPYTKQDFIDCYGGTAEWEKASVVKGEAQKERRRDPADGKMYTKDDFLACYGGTAEWDKAAPPQQAKPPQQQQQQQQQPKQAAQPVKVKAKPAQATAAPSGGEKRVDPTDGNAYTKQEFIGCYGGTAEWDAAAPKAKAGGAPAIAALTDDEVTALCQERQDARRSRDFKTADALKQRLLKLGVRLEDDARTWSALGGKRTGRWNAGAGGKGGGGGGKGGGNRGGEHGGGGGGRASAWTAGLDDAKNYEKKRAQKEDALSWGGHAGGGSTSVGEVFEPPSNAAMLDTFVCEAGDVKASDKVLVLLALPMEVFWGWLADSAKGRRWVEQHAVATIADGNGKAAEVDGAVRLLARIALHSEPLHTRFSLQSYAALFCDSIFAVRNLAAMAKAAARITLLKETICCVLLACHTHYFSNTGGRVGGRGALAQLMGEIQASINGVIFSKNWPAHAKEIASLRCTLVDTLWPLLKVAPFLVRCLSPISEWTRLLTVLYEVPLMTLHDKTDKKVGDDLCTACLDIVRLILQYFPFPEVEEGGGDSGYTQSRLEAALLAGLRMFSLITPCKFDRMPQKFDSLIAKTYGNEGAESFVLTEVLTKLHMHTAAALSEADAANNSRGGRGGGGGRSSGRATITMERTSDVRCAPGVFLIDLMSMYSMDTGLLKDALNMGRMSQDDLEGVCDIVGGLTRQQDIAAKPRAAAPAAAPAAGGASAGNGDFPATFPDEVETLLAIAGESGLIHSQHHAYSVLKYYDMNVERAVTAVFDCNIPPHLQDDTAPKGAAAAAPAAQQSGAASPSSSSAAVAAAESESSAAQLLAAAVKPQKAAAATCVSHPERFADFTKMRRHQKLSKEDQFDDALRQRIVAAAKSHLYDDEADDTCDYMPGGALEEEKKRRTMQVHAVEKAQVQIVSQPEAAVEKEKDLPPTASFDLPSDEEVAGYGSSGDEEDSDSDDATSEKSWRSGDKAKGDNRRKHPRGAGRGGGGDFPRTVSGASTGSFKGKSKIRNATEADKKRRSGLDKDKARYANHNRKDGASAKARKAMI